MVGLAFMLDIVVGDPAMMVRVHPVVLIGKLAERLERVLYCRTSRVRGGILVAMVCFSTYLGTRTLVASLGSLGWTMELWLLSTALATRGLYDAGMKIYQALKSHDVKQAQRYAGEIVGRDAHTLTRREIVRAAIESVSENIVDGVTAPLFYALIGGAPLAMLYKAVNTMDSMFGHKDERYYFFGWAAARLDDVATFIPARLTVPALLLAATLLGFNGLGAWRAIASDARKHKSPNSGIPEAGTAGALGVQLGGLNYYDGQAYEAPYLGDPSRDLTELDIPRTCHLMLLTSVIFLAAGLILQIILNRMV